ncbi:hypothetical protein SK128_003050 [Halocaridina rubra]|uniref:Uncharacterized protein n=1 Tax=Halocaridina rubra TaxID=373956 RepID=A0AAN8WTT5_HALRR
MDVRCSYALQEELHDPPYSNLIKIHCRSCHHVPRVHRLRSGVLQGNVLRKSLPLRSQGCVLTCTPPSMVLVTPTNRFSVSITDTVDESGGVRSSS